MTTVRQKRTEDVDRISALPDPVIHQIFSTMDTKQVVRTVLLSKRWKYLWKSTPFLNFHLPPCSFSKKIKRNAFMLFVDRVLFLRDASPIANFTLNFSDKLDASRVYSWIIAALDRNAREFRLELCNSEEFELPHNFFTSETTTVEIRVSMYDETVGIQMPFSMCIAPEMQSLELYGVRLPDGNSNGELLITCPVLKHMKLFDCDHGPLNRFIIYTPLLESLFLQNRKNSTDFMICICCQNLKSFHCHGKLYQDYALWGLSSLAYAFIGIDFCKSKQERDVPLMFNIFSAIQNVISLTLWTWPSKLIGDFPHQLLRFPNLKNLILHSHIVSVCGVANFLERLPNIVSLLWDRSGGNSIKEENWESSVPALSEFRYLKVVEIRDARKNEEELKFLQILLQKAIVLEKVVIKTKEQKTIFTDKLLNLPRASSSVSISCCPCHRSYWYI